MRFFKYWFKSTWSSPGEKEDHPMTCYGYSDQSVSDAQQQAEKIYQMIKDKINGLLVEGPDYSDIIREEIVQQIDSRNIISRNRAGVLVLNSEEIMMLDIDEYHDSIFSFFKNRKLSMDDKVLNMFQKLPLNIKGNEYGMRLYKTCKGYRLMLLGNYLAPDDQAMIRLMQTTQTDLLYRQMCLKQKCYRGRLTPKSTRLGMRMHHLKFPYDAKEQILFDSWLSNYDEKQRKYGTCSLVAVRGLDIKSEAVHYHDQMTRALEAQVDLK